jgi:hypothetical protein
MGSFNTAGQDPIFWLHHCNIDRLWESWNRVAGHTNPTWPNRSFPFANGQGQAVSVAAAKANRPSLLNYQYDAYATVPGGAFLLQEALPESVFTPEDFTDEHRAIAEPGFPLFEPNPSPPPHRTSPLDIDIPVEIRDLPHPRSGRNFFPRWHMRADATGHDCHGTVMTQPTACAGR